MNSRQLFNPITRPVIFYVTDGKALPSERRAGVLEAIRRAAAARVDFVQIREKDLLTGELLKMAREAVGIAKATNATRAIVNDRLDVALAAGASGVHLGQESAPAAKVIEWCRAGGAPKEFLVGVSCHSIEQARDAETAGASYVFFGPVFDTPAKRSFGPPQGVERLGKVCSAVEIPVIAIGGVSESNAADCIQAGAAGIAAIRLIQNAKSGEALAATVEGIQQMSVQREKMF